MTVAVLPAPGIYLLNGQRWEIRHSKRGQWYTMRQLGDGTWQYYAQNINPAWLAGPLGPSDHASEAALCATARCKLPVWHRGLCGMCLAKQAVKKKHSTTSRPG